MNEQSISNNPPVKNAASYKALLEIQEQEAKLKARSGYLKAYILSFFIPPIGIYYFIKYFFIADTSYENRKAAFLSLAITTASLLLNIWLLNLFFSQFAAKGSVNEQFIQDLITPANQKELQQLFE